MAGRRTKLTLELQDQIVRFICGGAFDHVAAQAAGIGPSTFYRWLERGEQQPRGPYAGFRTAVLDARAQARAGAEIEVHRDNPLAWLRYGPGRDRLGEPGWTDRQEHIVEQIPVKFTLKLGEDEDGPPLGGLPPDPLEP